MMKNYIYLLLSLVILSGCVTLETQGPGADKRKTLTSIAQVKDNMTYQEVQAVMGSKVTVGFQSSTPGNLQPIEMDNPVRVEKITSSNKTYFVLYYFTQIVKPDGLLSEDELTPLVFEAKGSSQNISPQDPLIGKGQDFVFRLKG
jgi:hypothetical protein